MVSLLKEQTMHIPMLSSCEETRFRIVTNSPTEFYQGCENQVPVQCVFENSRQFLFSPIGEELFSLAHTGSNGCMASSQNSRSCPG